MPLSPVSSEALARLTQALRQPHLDHGKSTEVEHSRVAPWWTASLATEKS